MVTFFRRPQTPFVQSDNTQAPQSQWKILADTTGSDPNNTNPNNSSSVRSSQEDKQGKGDDDHDMPDADNPNSTSTITTAPQDSSDHPMDEADPTTTTAAATTESSTNSTNKNNDNSVDDPKPPAQSSPSNATTSPNNTTTNNQQQHDQQLAPLQVTNHPDWILLCGYFHESHVQTSSLQSQQDDNNNTRHSNNPNDQTVVFLSTQLPGVRPTELKLHYAPGGVLKLAGERATHNTYQKFERHFALEEAWLDVHHLVATLDDGVLTVAVPQHASITSTHTPKPRTIQVVQASPLGLFRHRPDIQCWDVPVPGVALRDLTVEYEHGQLNIVWRQMMTQTYFVRALPINTLQVEIQKCMAYLDCPGGPQHAVLTLVAPLRLRINNYREIPIQVVTSPS